MENRERKEVFGRVHRTHVVQEGWPNMVRCDKALESHQLFLHVVVVADLPGRPGFVRSSFVALRSKLSRKQISEALLFRLKGASAIDGKSVISGARVH